jgi:hypothetical protein
MMKRLLLFFKTIKYLPMFVLILFTLSACASRSYMYFFKMSYAAMLEKDGMCELIALQITQPNEWEV